LGTLSGPVTAEPLLTRRSALRRLAGLGTALGLLVGGKLALPAGVHAEGAGEARPWWAVEPVKTSVLDPLAAEKLLAELLAGPDLPAVVGPAQLTEVQAAEHRLTDGRTLWALAGAVGADEVVVGYRNDAGRVAALRYRIVAENNAPQLVAIVATSGVLPDVRGGDAGPLPQQTCTPPLIPCSSCCRFDWQRFVECCGWTCFFVCATSRSWPICAACTLVRCPWCLSVSCPGGWSCTTCCAEPGT
ncbi:MAG: Tat (twin-arginine translocation) pathway signal sequence domain-containing protein, partial [Thermomicrobium sp.]|nr:Tat (twin-arginine translocation) pathway signal sequence domain-containing protein [Thermomicrobium sp.]